MANSGSTVESDAVKPVSNTSEGIKLVPDNWRYKHEVPFEPLRLSGSYGPLAIDETCLVCCLQRC